MSVLPAYATVEQVAQALDVAPSGHDTARLYRHVLAASRIIERRLHRHFYPDTTSYDYHLGGGGSGFWLERDLLAMTAVTADGTTQTIADIDVSPADAPYQWVGVSGTDVTITGTWGFTNTTEPAGALDEAVADTTGTSIVVTNSAAIGIGDLLTIESERLIVTAKTQTDTTVNVTANLTAQANDVTVTVNDGTLLNEGETILVDSERMLITDIAGNTLTVIRAVDGTTLAAHTQPVDVYARRTLTVVRGATGTTAATHADTVTITRNLPPHPITQLAIAEAAVTLTQETSAYGRTIGSGDNVLEARGVGLADARRQADHYRRVRMAAI